MINDEIKIKGMITYKLFNEEGKLKQFGTIANTITSAGKNGLADQVLASPTLTKFGWMELGTGTGGTTALNAYISGSRTAFGSLTRATNVITAVVTFGAGVGTGTVTEAGTFDSSTQNAGNMWNYSSFGAITKAAGDSLQITWTITLS